MLGISSELDKEGPSPREAEVFVSYLKKKKKIKTEELSVHMLYL